MKSSELYQDVATLLFLLPFIIPAVYALYLWPSYGLSPFLPSQVYVQITRDPYVFMAGLFSVVVGSLIEVSSFPPEERAQRIVQLSSNLQKIAVASFLLALFVSWYSNHFIDVSSTFLDFLVGRFNVLFPAFLAFYSFILVIPFNVSWIRNRYFISSLLLVLIFPVLYLGRHHPTFSFSVSFLMLILAVAIFSLTRGEHRDKEKT